MIEVSKKMDSLDLPKELKKRRKIIRNKLYLCMFMKSNPCLIEYRKKNSGYFKKVTCVPFKKKQIQFFKKARQ